MRTQPRLSDREREQRRERDRERLKQAAEQLLTSEGWQRWVRVRARGGLARLSLNNQLLVALSCPDATFVAGFRAWLKLGYCVPKGEKAIRIVAAGVHRLVRDDPGGDRRVVRSEGTPDRRRRRPAANAQLRILIHETIHGLGGSGGGVMTRHPEKPWLARTVRVSRASVATEMQSCWAWILKSVSWRRDLPLLLTPLPARL
jgi:hypothetical protein